MEQKLNQLKTIFRERYDLLNAARLLHWDQATNMPKGGADARGRHSALLTMLSHEKLIDPTTQRLLDELQSYGESLPYDHDDAAYLRAARREMEREGKAPAEFMSRFTEHTALSYQAWSEARPNNDWNKVEPYLEKTLDLSRQFSSFFPGYEHIADPLIGLSDYGLKAGDVRRVFEELRTELAPLIQAIGQQEQVDDSCLRQHFPHEAQLKFSEAVVRDLGYDFDRGRIDLSPHPFTTMFSIGDVRFTVRVNENDFSDCLFSAIHEAGHAFHIQGCNPAYEASPLNSFVSAGVAESQSRTWENIVGRSREFWEHYYPKLQSAFPEQLKHFELETFYRAINKVQPSLIRTDADEVTYNLHPLIRFELELEMLEGSLAVKDLPEAWNERYSRYLGITPPNHQDGVLQDVHWYYSMIGGLFQGYTLGNILSAMFYEQALSEQPDLPDQFRAGRFAPLHSWLKEKIYWHGDKYTAPEIIERLTGGTLNVQPLIRYFKRKYSQIYSL